MAAKTVPISGSVLGWAREEAGLTRLGLAERAKLSVEDIGAWEAGTGLPTKGQFSQLVKILKRPSAVFFLPEPPSSASMPTALRRAPGLGAHKLGPDEMHKIRWARRLQEITSWVLKDDGKSPVVLDQHRLRTDPVEAADLERKRSGVTTGEQLAWPSPSAAFRAWRSYLEQQGVLVLQLSMGKNNIRGFGAWDEYAPLVAVNTAYHPTARIFTLFHEVGHLLTRTDAACQSFVLPDSHDIEAERWCERYAASFLLPKAELRKVAEGYGISPDSPTTDPGKARLIANRFSVSTRATAIRLQEISLAEPSLYGAVASQLAEQDWNITSGGGGGGQTAIEKRLGQLGTRIPDTLMAAADSERLTTRDLADLLQLHTRELCDMKVILS